MFKYLLLITTLALVAGCRETAKVTPWSTAKQMPPPPGFITEVPLEKRGRDSGKTTRFYVYKQRYCKWFHLDSLEAGFDSIQIRVWPSNDMAKQKHIVIIEKTGLQWDAKLLTIQGKALNADESQHKEELTSTIACTPVHGWDYFLKKMKELRITELPNGEDIDGYHGCGADGTGYLFEIATRYKYRFIEYCSPKDYADHIWQAKNVLTFIDLLEEEFGFKATRW